MGTEINNGVYAHNLFADDQVVIAQDMEDAMYMCRKIQEEYNTWGLNINMVRTTEN